MVVIEEVNKGRRGYAGGAEALVIKEKDKVCVLKKEPKRNSFGNLQTGLNESNMRV